MYTANKTMELIGQQTLANMLTDENLQQLREIKEANEQSYGLLNEDTLVDAFVLGFIYGQRKERGRK